MLRKTAFANALTAATVAFYAVFYIINLGAPTVFQFLFNAQFFGANIAQFIPQEPSLAVFVQTILAVAPVVWIFSYAWAWFYNRFTK